MANAGKIEVVEPSLPTLPQEENFGLSDSRLKQEIDILRVFQNT